MMLCIELTLEEVAHRDVLCASDCHTWQEFVPWAHQNQECLVQGRLLILMSKFNAALANQENTNAAKQTIRWVERDRQEIDKRYN